MRIRYVKGDLLAAEEIIIIHGCNAMGVMGRGVAKAIKEQLPFAYEAYRSAFFRPLIERDNLRSHPASLHLRLYGPIPNGFEGDLFLGQVVWAINLTKEMKRIVGNAITQYDYKADAQTAIGGRNVDYAGVESCMREVNRFAKIMHETNQHYDFSSVGMPMIGAGLGGGDWGKIEAIIEEQATDFQPVVYQLA